MTSPPPTTSIGSCLSLDGEIARYVTGTHLSEDSELVHGVNNGQEGVDRLGLLSNHCLVHIELNVVMVEVALHGLAVKIEDIGVHDSQTTTPLLVAVRKVAACRIKDIVNEGEVVFNLLVALNVEALASLGDGGLEVRHNSTKKVWCEEVETD